MTKPLALFASVLLALAGAEALQIWSLISAFMFTSQLPTTSTFSIAFWFWFVTAIVVVWCGLQGGYALLRTGSVANPTLTVFVVMSCLMFKVSGQELGYSAVRLGVNFGIPSIQLGVNILGFVMVWWLVDLRQRSARPLRPLVEDEATRGRGAV